MHNDEVVWQVLGNNFCSYKVKIENDTFCRNKYNVTGQCNRVSCPLANGYYATVLEDEGQCYLYLKTIERVHLPSKTWEVIKLSSNYQEALEQITTHMKNIYKDHQIHRCKQRLTRLRQTLLRMRKMQLTPQRTVVPIKQKTERRELLREKKAEKAARLEVSIENELLQRLKQGVYGDIYNYDRVAFEKMLDMHEEQQQADSLEQHVEFVEDEEDVEELDEEEEDEALYAHLKEQLKRHREFENNDIEDMEEDVEEYAEAYSVQNGKPPLTTGTKKRAARKAASGSVHDKRPHKRRPAPRVEIEYEEDLTSQCVPETLV